MKLKLSLPWQILIAIALGVLFGFFFHNYTEYIAWAGDIFLRLLKMIVIPIVFSSLVVGVASIGKSADLGRVAGKTFLFYISTTLVATIIGLLLVNIFKPGVGVEIAPSEVVSGESVSFLDQIINIFPSNIFSSLSNGDLLQVIFFAMIFGFFITKSTDKVRTTLIDLFQAVFEVVMKITLFIIKLTPFGVFSIVATMIAKEAGDMEKLINIAHSLGMYLLIVWGGCLIQGGIVLPSLVKILGKENPWRHIQKMSTAILTAFSTCSSGAALPISLKDSQEKCGISNKIASFTLPLGATINMNGTALYEGVTVLFIAQAYGVDLTIGNQILILGTVLLAAIGAAGIPMAGLVMLSVVLSVAGLPLEGVGLVIAVQQLCDMPRTALNSYGDMCGAVVIAKSEGEKLTI